MADSPKKEFFLDDSNFICDTGGGFKVYDKFRELGRNNYAIFCERKNKFDIIIEIQQIPRHDIERPKVGEKGYHSTVPRNYSLVDPWQFSEKALEAVMDDKTNPFIFARGEDKKSVLATLDRALVDDIIYRDKDRNEKTMTSEKVARLAIEEIKKIDPNRYGSRDMRLSIYRVARNLKEKDPEKQMEEFKSNLASLMSSREMVATMFANELAMRLDCHYGQYSQIKNTLLIMPEGLLNFMDENGYSYYEFDSAFNDKFSERVLKKSIDLIEDVVTRTKNNMVFNYDPRADNTLKPTFLKRLYKELAVYMEPYMEKLDKASKKIEETERSAQEEATTAMRKIFEKRDKAIKKAFNEIEL